MAEEKFADIESVEDLGNEAAIAEANKPAAYVAQVDNGTVQVTITKFGDGKVSTGIHVAGEGDIYAGRGDKLMVSKEIAALLETRGLAEIE